MKLLLALLEKEGRIGIVGLLVLIALVWFGGEYLGYPNQTRAVVIIVVIGVWCLLNVLSRMLAVRRSALIERRLREQAREQVAGARPDRKPEVQALEQRLAEAIQSLKASKLGNSALYALPWYMIIGPPGCGKSTLLQQSGLNFPYTSQGNRGIRGVGGTRNCDWWFTDQAIFLDTAGRYTTELDDREEWLAFLDMIKRARKQKPINGVTVCVSVSDLVQGTDEEFQDHAKKVRERLDELTQRLELVFPVYLVFTKLDLLNGFVDFFEDMNKTERAQVWGRTLPFGKQDRTQLAGLFEEECKKMYQTLCAKRVAALSIERKAEKKRNIYHFPLQFALVHKRLADFVGEVFQPNPFQETCQLRGFYFTSGTQEGTPIDKVVSSMRQAFGLAEGEQAVAPVVEKKSYFILDLVKSVIFPDAPLSRSTTHVQRRQRLMRFLTAAGSVLGLVCASLLFSYSCSGNRLQIDQVEGAAVKAKKIDWNNRERLDENMQAIEELRRQIEALDQGAPLLMRLGLYQGSTARDPARRLYFDRLKKGFIDPSGQIVHDDLKNLKTAPSDFVAAHELFRSYRMMTVGYKIEPKMLKRQLESRWLAKFGSISSNNQELAKNQLEFYVAQLGQKDCPRVQHEDVESVLREARNILSGQARVGNSYAALKKDALQKYPPEAAPAIVPSFNTELFAASENVAFMFTYNGWTQYIEAKTTEEAKYLHEAYEDYDLEKKEDVQSIAATLRGLYFRDCAEEWLRFFKGLKLKSFPDLQTAADRIKLLAGNDSPYRPMVKELWKRLRPTVQASGTNPTDVISAWISSAYQNKVTGDPPVEDLKWLDEALAPLVDLTGEFNKLLKSAYSAKTLLELDRESVQKVRQKIEDVTEKQKVPRMIRDLVVDLLQQTADQSRGCLVRAAQKELDKAWSRDVYDVFKQTLASKYPFNPQGDSASAKDFSDLFHPKTGKLWVLYNTEIEPWHKLSQTTAEYKVEFTKEWLESFAKAKALTEAMFAPDLEVPFEFKIFQGQSAVVEVLFKVGSRDFRYRNEPEHFEKLVWNKKDDQPGSVLQVKVGAEEKAFALRFDDAWGLFRLIDKATVAPKGPNLSLKWKIDTDQGPVEVECELQPAGSNHPFQKEFFTGLKVPPKVGP